MPPKPAPYRLKDGTVRWAVRFRLTPGTNPVKETFTTQAEAQKFVRLLDAVGPTAARQARAASDTADHHTPSLAAWLDTYLERLAAARTPGTVADYRRMAARTWLPTLGPLPLDAITRDAVVRWVGQQRTTETARSVRARQRDPKAKPVTYSPKSIANAQRLLSTVLQAAVDAGLTPTNVARGVDLPNDHATEEMVFLTPDEFTRLLAHIPDYWQPLVLTLYTTGLRWGEATALAASSVNLDHPPTVRVSRAWKKDETGVYLGGPKTFRGRRTVTLPHALIPVLQTQLKGRRGDDLVFTAKEGGRVRGQNFHDRVWAPAVRAAELGKRPRVHDLRHSHASALIAAGIPLTVIQRRLGHESIKTTSDTYGHLAAEAHAGAAEVADLTIAAVLPQIEP